MFGEGLPVSQTTALKAEDCSVLRIPWSMAACCQQGEPRHLQHRVVAGHPQPPVGCRVDWMSAGERSKSGHEQERGIGDKAAFHEAAAAGRSDRQPRVEVAGHDEGPRPTERGGWFVDEIKRRLVEHWHTRLEAKARRKRADTPIVVAHHKHEGSGGQPAAQGSPFGKHLLCAATPSMEQVTEHQHALGLVPRDELFESGEILLRRALWHRQAGMAECGCLAQMEIGHKERAAGREPGRPTGKQEDVGLFISRQIPVGSHNAHARSPSERKANGRNESTRKILAVGSGFEFLRHAGDLGEPVLR